MSGGFGSGGLFGKPTQSNGKGNDDKSSQPSSLFGSTAPTTTASASGSTAPSLFGSATGTSNASPFSNAGALNNSGPSSVFGTNAQSSGQGTLFGGSSNNSSGSLFAPTGNKPNSDSSKTNTNMFANMGTPNKQSSSDTGNQSQGGGLFAQTGSSTPANKLFGTKNDTSTTPAGPPPANASASLFGNGGGSKPGGLFGSVGNASGTSSAPQTSSGGGLFGSNPAAPTTSPFGGAPASSGGSIFPNMGQKKDQANQQSGTPGTSGVEGSQGSNLATSSQENAATKPTSLFPSSTSQATSSGGQAATAAPSMAPNPFNAIGSSKDAGASTSQAPSLFGAAPPKLDATTTQSSTPSLFSSTNTTQKASGTPASAANTQTTSSNTTTSGPSLFGGTTSASTSAPSAFNSTGQTSDANNKADGATSAAPKPDLAASSSGLGASTTGQPPSAQSRLKNKSMDDIITRWASDLTKYQKDFQSQASKVSQWDRQLVENSNAISKLYSKTFQAERDTAEIQKQLTTVEGHQDELSQWLDRYEQDVDELMSRQVNPADGFQGPDQEREQAYRTAEQVSERLGEMGQDLTSMIDEINAASSAVSKTNRADDPLSQIVRVLNGHLSQLQLIDQGTAELQAKVTAAQRESQRLGARGRNGIGYDAAEEFGRSYMGRS